MIERNDSAQSPDFVYYHKLFLIIYEIHILSEMILDRNLITRMGINAIILPVQYELERAIRNRI